VLLKSQALKANVMKAFGLFLLNVLSDGAKSFGGGLVLSRLWAWFVTPVFTSLPRLSTGTAIGLMLVIEFLLSGVSMLASLDITEDTDWEEVFVKAIVRDVLFIVLVYPLTFAGAFAWHQLI